MESVGTAAKDIAKDASSAAKETARSAWSVFKAAASSVRGAAHGVVDTVIPAVTGSGNGVASRTPATEGVADASKESPANRGTVESLVYRGRHALLTKVLHRVDASRDEEFSAAKRRSENSEKLVVEIQKRCDVIASSTEKLCSAFDDLVVLLDELSVQGSCDEEDHVVHREALLSETENLKLQCEGMTEGLTGSCFAILSTTLKDLREQSAKLRKTVSDAEMKLDMSRSEEVAARSELETALAKAGNAGQKQSTSEAREGDSVDLARLNLRLKQTEVMENRKEYSDKVEQSKSAIRFLFDQVAMGTLSAVDVLFGQFSHFFSESAERSTRICTTLKLLKNEMRVSRKLTLERKERLQQNVSPSRSSEADEVTKNRNSPPIDDEDFFASRASSSAKAEPTKPSELWDDLLPPSAPKPTHADPVAPERKSTTFDEMFQ